MAGSAQREIAFVTGAAQGIGLATAARLARDGFRVVAMDRSADRLRAEVARLRGEGLNVEATVTNVCDRASVIAALEAQPRVDAVSFDNVEQVPCEVRLGKQCVEPAEVALDRWARRHCAPPYLATSRSTTSPSSSR